MTPQDSSELAQPGMTNLHMLDYWRVIRVRLPLIILVFLLVVITAGVATYLTPRQYQSSVTMQVKEDNNNMHIFGAEGSRGVDPRFSTTQFQIIQRKEVLYPVINTMKLLQKWDLRSKDVAFMRLRKMMSISEIRGTDLIQISVLDEDRQEAADLANTIALEYQKKRIDEQQGWVARSLVQLEDEVNKQRIKTEGFRDAMTKMRVEAKINDLNPESVEDLSLAEKNILISVEGQVNDARIKVATLRSKQEQIQGMTDDQIIRSLKTFEMDDATISQILPQYEACVSQEAHLLNSGLGPNHPSIQSLQATKTVYGKQLKDQIGILRKSLAANLEINQKALEAMELKLNEARTGEQDSKSKSLHYQEAKNEYLKAKRILESAEARYSTEAMQRTMPQSPATIWEKAEVSDFPAKPRVGQNMAIAVAVGLALGVGLAFLIEYLDTSVKTISDLEHAFGVPVLAVIPRGAQSLIQLPSNVPIAEGYRIMRANIILRTEGLSKALTVVSGGQGEGKSTTINNLAYVFAKGGYKTLIIDADIRRPSQHEFFGIKKDFGLADYLLNGSPYNELIKDSGVTNLSILTSGICDLEDIDILDSPKIMELIRDSKSSYDIVFIDSPPILAIGDASVIANAVDMVIVVVQHCRFPKAMLERLKQRLNDMRANVIGCVLNNTDVRHDQSYAYYGGYYEYYGPQESKNTAIQASRKIDSSKMGKHGEY